jgi:hypothetical protein
MTDSLRWASRVIYRPNGQEEMIMKTLFNRARVRTIGVAVALVALAATGAAAAAGPKAPSTTFSLFPNKAFQNCLAAPGETPQATVRVKRGEANDRLVLKVENLKPNLDFDVFTVEKTPQLADGSVNPAFGGNFGFAWYQSDLHSNGEGEAEVTIKTILLDQIFGFDASRGVTPVNTFNLGFWFNDPADAAACGFTGATPFNGEHHAGPLAMITRLDATTKLGPLCTDPEANGDGSFHCNP